MSKTEEITASGSSGDSRRRESPGPDHSSQGSVKQARLWSHCFRSLVPGASASSSQPAHPSTELSTAHQSTEQSTADQLTERAVDIEKIWMLRNNGARFPAANGKNRWKLVKFAENYWTKESEESAKRLDAYSTNLASSNNQLYQLIGFYIVFQGVLLTAVVQTNRLNCSLFWLPLALCLIASVCFALGSWLKFNEITKFRYERNRFNLINKRRESQLTKLKGLREKYNFSEPDEEYSSTPNLRARLIKYSTWCAAPVLGLAFTILMCFLIRVVLCDKLKSTTL